MRNGIVDYHHHPRDRDDQNGGGSHDERDDGHDDFYCNGEEKTSKHLLSFDEEEAIVKRSQYQQKYPTSPSQVGTYNTNGGDGGGITIHRRRPTTTRRTARQKLQESHEEEQNSQQLNGNGTYYHNNNNNNNRFRRKKKTTKRKNQTYANIETIVWLCSGIILFIWIRMIWNRFVNNNNNDAIVDVVPWLPHHYSELPIAARSSRRRRMSLKMNPSNNRTTTIHNNNDLSNIEYHHHYYYYGGRSSSINKNNMNVISVEDWRNISMIHIVNTRFMQEQGYLKELGKARLLLFQTVCLPSMVHQSTQNFIWIVKTDPKLDPSILRQLQRLLLPYPNFYLVGSNNNYLIRSTVPIIKPNNGTTATPIKIRNDGEEIEEEEGYDIYEDVDEDPKIGVAWRDGGEGYDLLQSKIYSGNLTHLYQAMALRHRLPILETRLDADDGLHQQYLQYVQAVAYQRFFTTSKRRNRRRDNNVQHNNDQKDDKDDPEGEEEAMVDKNTAKEKEDDEAEDSVDDDDDDGESDSVSTTTPTNVKWLYWCARRHMEWHINVNQTSSSKHKKNKNKNNEATPPTTTAEDEIASRINAIGGSGGLTTLQDDKFPMGILNPVVRL